MQYKTFTHKKVSRRDALRLGAITSAALSLPACVLTQPSSSKKVGIQLYTLRDMMKDSVIDTLKLVAKTGYKELEFAGYYDHDPKEIRALIDAEGMTAPSAHALLDVFEKNLGSLIDSATTVGHEYLVLPYLREHEQPKTEDGWKLFAEKLNAFGAACKKSGIAFAYHNHAFEFEALPSGALPMDIMLQNSDPELVGMELDLYWIKKAGYEPVDYFKRYPGRFPLWHVKDMDQSGSFADVGHGTISFEEIFAQAELSGVKHYFVEHDNTDAPLRTIQRSYASVKSLLLS